MNAHWCTYLSKEMPFQKNIKTKLKMHLPSGPHIQIRIHADNNENRSNHLKWKRGVKF